MEELERRLYNALLWADSFEDFRFRMRDYFEQKKKAEVVKPQPCCCNEWSCDYCSPLIT